MYENEEILKQIQEELYSRELEGKECAQILWGFILNAPLEGRLLGKIIKGLVEGKEELDGWDLSTTVWSFSKFEDHG